MTVQVIPPVIELVLSLQFEPIDLNSGVFSKIWQRLFSDYQFLEDASPLDDQFETFGGSYPPRDILRLVPVEKHSPRYVLINENRDRIVQMQSTRFFCNWRLRDGQTYPDYEPFRDWYLEQFIALDSFVSEELGGKLSLNQFELTYVDCFPKGDLWENVSEWQRVLPGLFSVLSIPSGLELVNRAARWSFDIPGEFGRLHVSTNFGQPNLEGLITTKSLLMNSTLRGPIDSPSSIAAVLDRAHRIVVDYFKSICDRSVLDRCT